MDGSLTAVSPEARIYALTELIRRAGVTGEFYKRWEVESTPLGDLVVRPQRGASGQVRFPLASGELQIDEVVRKTWHGEAPAEFRDVVPNFIVPFSTPASVAGRPLFTQEGPGRFSCTEDILASIVLTLSRFEEIVSPARDDHGRFPASASAAFCRNYLNRPIVDEYGLALQQILELLMPGWRPAPRALRVKITHDLDQIGIPFSLKSTIGHLLKRKSPLFFMRDFLSLGTGVEPAFLKQVRDICQLSLQRHLHSTLYWMASTPGPSDWGYDVEDLRIARVMRWAREHDVEMGVHPGYDTFLSPALLEQQVQRCRKALQNERIGGRQHYLRWRPKTWVHWERCGLLYDSSVGFVNYPGFRAGTCVPYLPWLWFENRRADLLEIPLVVMDVALLAIDHGKVLEVVEKLVQRCAVVGGVCTLVWHNNRLASPEGRYYPGVLDALSSGSDYDWQTDLAQLRQLACNGSQHKLSSATKRAGIAHTAARREAVVTGTNDCGRA